MKMTDEGWTSLPKEGGRKVLYGKKLVLRRKTAINEIELLFPRITERTAQALSSSFSFL